jgi:hypothetical protein
MTGDQFDLLQRALLYTFEPIIGWWLVGLASYSILVALYIFMLALLRWMTGKSV